MSNQIYGKAREAFARGLIDWGVGTSGAAIHLDFVDLADYTVSIASHEFRSSVPSGARVATAGPLTGKTATLGVLDAADLTATAVTGDQFEAVILFVNTGSDATSRLLIFLDTASGLPGTPVGGDFTVAWDNGANKIATL